MLFNQYDTHMIQPLNFQQMHVNEKGTFTNKILDVATPYKALHPEFVPVFDEVTAKNQIFSKALQKLSFENITRLMEQDHKLRCNGFVNLRDYALTCSMRKNVNWKLAGQVLVDHIRLIGWDTAQKTNAEATSLLETLLNELDNTPALKQSITTINAEEWLDEIRQGQTSYVTHEAQRRLLKTNNTKVSTREAARHLGFALDKMVRYVNFHIEFEKNADFMNLAQTINVIIADTSAILKQRATRIKNAKKKKAANDGEEKDT